MCVNLTLFYCIAFCLQGLAFPTLTEHDIKRVSKSLVEKTYQG